NWDSGLPSAVPSVAIFDGSVTTKRTLDLATTSRNCTGIRFDLSSGAVGFTFNASTPPGGYQIRAGGVPSGILNNDDSAQTFNVPMKIFTSGGGNGSGAAQSWKAAGGDLIFTGNYNTNKALVDLNGGNLTIDGSFDVTLGTTGLGIISNTFASGTAGIIKNGAGTLT